jgi:hypothetical protein
LQFDVDENKIVRGSRYDEELAMQTRRRRAAHETDQVEAEHANAPRHVLLDLQRSAGNQAVGRMLARYVTDNRGRRMNDDDVRAALIKQFRVADTDQESLAVIEAVIKDPGEKGKGHKYSDVEKMMPEPRYVPSGQRETALEMVSDMGYRPLGFKTHDDFAAFINTIYRNMLAADATVVFHGSSLSGQSYKDKGGSRLFDVGRDSDYDVAIASESLWQLAQDPTVNIKIRGGDHSEPLTAEGLDKLGLAKAHAAANFAARREVNFMLYQNVETAHGHEGMVLVAPRSADYRELYTQLHGKVAK